METPKVLGLAALSILTVSINGLPLVPVGFIIALPLVARSGIGGSLWTGIKDNWSKVLTCLVGLLVGIVALQASCDVRVARDGFGFGAFFRVLPIRDWLPTSAA